MGKFFDLSVGDLGAISIATMAFALVVILANSAVCC